MRRTIKSALIFTLSTIAALEAGWADTHYVSTTGNNTWPYTTRATAARNFHMGIAAAHDGDTVLVANGLYAMYDQVNIFKRILVRSENGAAQTILHALRATNQYWRCLYVSNAAAVVAGFTIRNGRAQPGVGQYPANGWGGGVNLRAGSTLRNCVIVSNRAVNGGGVYMLDNCRMVNCTVANNIASQGGGIESYRECVISTCTIGNNIATNRGGGIFVRAGTILRSVFRENVALGQGGGAYLGEAAILENSSFIHNNSQVHAGPSEGGGVYAASGTRINRCIFVGNSCTTTSEKGAGGGVFLDHYGTIIENSLVTNNYSFGYGGGLYLTNNAAVRNCVVAHNAAEGTFSGTGHGGGIYASHGRIENCTVVSNFARSRGGGIMSYYTVLGINSIITGNRALLSGSQLQTQSGVAWSNSCCFFLSGGGGNITNDPKFVTTDGRSYTLSISSRCINRGQYRSWMAGSLDFMGHKRIMLGAPDIGAVEYGGVLNDYNLNGKADMMTTLGATTSVDWYGAEADGTISLWRMVQSGPNNARPYQAVPGDYNGDGLVDHAIFVPTTAKWYIYSRAYGGATILDGADWGYAGCIAVPGDYNGDGQSDLAVFDPAAGLWYIRTVSGTILAWRVLWRAGNCVPVAGDYDGDGRSDLAVYEPSTTKWYIRTRSGITLVDGWTWGVTGCTPVPGDYDGDGISDLIYYRLDGATGRWSVKNLRREVLARNLPWGFAGCTPLMADFNGGGLMDLALYHQASSLWYIFQPATGQAIANGMAWGGPSMPAVKQ